MAAPPHRGSKHARKTKAQLIAELERLQQAGGASGPTGTDLLAALEPLVDGLILLDADDRLIYMNDRYRQDYARHFSRDPIGLTFEELLREGAAAGLIPEADAGLEDWIRDRLALYDRKAAPVRVERSLDRDARIELHHLPVPGGGALIVYRDITERERAESELRHSEAQFRDLIEVSLQGILIMDIDWNLRFVNQAAADIFGFASPEEMLASGNMALRIAPHEIPRITGYRDARLRGEAVPVGYQYEGRRKDGSSVWVQNSSRMLQWDGETAILATLIDTTEQRRAEMAVSDSERRFRDFAEAASDWFWELDQDLRFSFVSNRITAATGMSPAEFVGKRRDEVAPVEDEPEKWRQHMADLSARRPFRDFVYWRVNPQGERRYLKISALPVFDDDGAFRGYRGTGSDITAEIGAQQREEAVRDRLREVIDSLPLALHLWDADGRLVMANRTQHEWFPEHRTAMQPGARFEEHVRINAERNFVSVDRYRIEAYVQERLENFRNPAPGGPEEQWVKDRWLHVVNHRLPDGGTICLRFDITEPKQREEQLHQAQKMEAVGQLTGGVAHDFNNLIAVIMGHGELLREALADRSVRSLNSVDAILRAAERGADLTQRLLAFSRRQPLAPQPINCNDQLPEIAALLRRTLGEQIEVETVLAGGLWRCLADRGQLENALLNLAINARDAMPGGGKLTIEAANARLDDDYAAVQEDVAPGQYVLLAVTDTGIGIPDAILPRLFEPFFTTKAPGQGSGLGLSMVYGFAKQSGGHLAIYSEEGQGTTVKLYLPRTNMTGMAEPGRQKTAPRQGDEAVLVVEDDADVRQLAVRLLDDLGYRVLSAADGTAALAILQDERRIDLLLTDVVLTGEMGGAELAAEARRRRSDIGVLFMSGYPENAIVHQGKLDEGVTLLQKPFRKLDLARKVRQVLDETPGQGQ